MTPSCSGLPDRSKFRRAACIQVKMRLPSISPNSQRQITSGKSVLYQKDTCPALGIQEVPLFTPPESGGVEEVREPMSRAALAFRASGSALSFHGPVWVTPLRNINLMGRSLSRGGGRGRRGRWLVLGGSCQLCFSLGVKWRSPCLYGN